MLLDFLDLTDLSGTSQASVTLGALLGTPVISPAYNGRSDLDWWYPIDPSGLDPSRIALQRLSGSINAKQLNATGRIDLVLELGGQVSVMRLSNAKLRATIGTATTPLASAAGSTPGHLPAEQVDPELTSFATMVSGALCANISAASLAVTPIPLALLAAAASRAARTTLPPTAYSISWSVDAACSVASLRSSWRHSQTRRTTSLSRLALAVPTRCPPGRAGESRAARQEQRAG